MKPRNKYERALAEIQKQYRHLSEAKAKWFEEQCFSKQGIYSRKRIYCAECGQWHKSDFHLIQILEPVTCPHCGLSLEVKHLRETKYCNTAYGMVMDTFRGYQIVRLIFCKKYITKGHPVIFCIDEVLQHWIDKNGRDTIFSLRCQGMSAYYDSWILDGNLEIRQISNNYRNRQNIYSSVIHPYRKYLPEVIRNGFKGWFYDIPPQDLLSVILSNSMAETLLKARYVKLLKYMINDYHGFINVQKYWSSIKICIRNNYIPNNINDWFDYLELLVFFRKDLYSPVYICCDDLETEHNRLVKKKNRIALNDKIEKVKEKIKEHEMNYLREKEKFFDLYFADENIQVTPLRSVMEFLEEGNEFGHCIFSNKYFNKSDSLLLSAKINDERIETIQVSLSSLEVIQARGVNNKPTKYHKRIVRLVNNNMPVIAKVMAQK